MTPDVRSVALSLMEGLDCPRALTVAILIRYEEWAQLVSLETSPEHYDTPLRYADACQATDFLRKCEGLATGIDTTAAAISKWWWAEKECHKTNIRFAALLEGDHSLLDERAFGLLDQARKICRWILGERPPPTWEGKFGPGATVSDTSRACTIPDKMSSVPTLSHQCWPYLVPWSGTKWASASATLGRTPEFVRGNVYFTVPKDAKTDRSCAKEPSINGFYQLGLGRVMRRRLRSVGIDLETGQVLHGQVARLASKLGHLSTVDLSSASDCVAKNLVKFLLPPLWYEVLDDLRSHSTTGPLGPDGKVITVRLEKFSSMGNGFTFELETVIFLSLVLACCPDSTRVGRDVLVYGDDIIAPTNVTPLLLSVLRYCGFTPNPRKTFYEGSFRESCGSDYYNGEPVRAHFCKKLPQEPADWIALANGIRRAAFQNVASLDRWSRFRSTWFRVLDQIPTSIRSCRGPEALGDLVVHDEPGRWRLRVRSSIRYVMVYRVHRSQKVRWRGFAYDVQLASALYGPVWELPCRVGYGVTEAGENRDRYITPRDAVLSYKVGWVPFS